MGLYIVFFLVEGGGWKVGMEDIFMQWGTGTKTLFFFN